MADKIGKMRERITFQEHVETEDTFGGRNRAWSNLASNPTVWARVEPVNTAEVFDRANRETRYDWKVTCRWRDDVNTGDRIQWRGRTLSIVQPPRNVDERDRFLEFVCLEGGQD